LESMFYSLSKLERDDGGPGPLTLDVKRAAWNVMVIFCETRRLRSLLTEVNQRLRNDSPPYKLEFEYWELIHDWSDFSKVVLEERLNGTLALPNLTRQWCIEHHQKATMNSLVGIWGELLKIKFHRTSLGLTPHEFQEHWMQAGGNIPEPGFVPQL